jgi:ABC-type lipoprotein release transport system permease subunit
MAVVVVAAQARVCLKLAAGANLGRLFSARAADRSREIAVRIALGSRRQLILRQFLTEALSVSVTGGICGMAAAISILCVLSAWRPIPDIPINVPVNPERAALPYAMCCLACRSPSARAAMASRPEA